MVKALIAATAIIVATPALAQQTIGSLLQPGETLLQVSAEGEATVLPDAAFVSVGVVTSGATARAATDANAERMAAVIAALRKSGVDARYVRTQQISVEPNFARVPGSYETTSQITGYVARNSVAVTVVKLAIAPDVIAAAFGAGANSVSGPNLGTENRNAGLADARTNALRNAREEADAYAAGLGMKVARVIRVSENGGRIEPLEYVTVTGSRIGAPPTPPPPPPPAPIAAGELKRNVTV